MDIEVAALAVESMPREEAVEMLKALRLRFPPPFYPWAWCLPMTGSRMPRVAAFDESTQRLEHLTIAAAVDTAHRAAEGHTVERFPVVGRRGRANLYGHEIVEVSHDTRICVILRSGRADALRALAVRYLLVDTLLLEKAL